MTDLLDLSSAALSRDRSALNRLVLAVGANTGKPYDQALHLLMAAFDAAPRKTAAAALRDQGVDMRVLEQVDEDLKTLERADRVQAEAHAKAAAADTGRVDPFGRVLLDQAANVGAMLHDPVVAENRYRAARPFDARYQHPETGRAAWDQDDRAAIDSGVDLLKTYQRPQLLEAAQAPVRRLARSVDEAWRAGDTPSERKMLLDAAIRDHRSQVRLLDQAAATATAPSNRRNGPLVPVMLDQGDPEPTEESKRIAAAAVAQFKRDGTPVVDTINRLLGVS